jgi:type II secretory pathway pseudopilin PulG
MKKKAFTLIELLAIIIVLTGIFAIVIPEVNKALTNRKMKEFKELSTSIENAAKLFVSENYEIGVDTIPEFLTLRDLTDNDMLDSPLIDPRNGSEFNPDTVITILEDEDGVLLYTFDDSNLLPTVVTTSIVSNNSINNKYAKSGNTVTLTIKFNKAITNNPTIEFEGLNATNISGTGNTRVATYLTGAGFPEGVIDISIENYKDSGNITGDPFSTITTGGTVTYDSVPPTYTYFYIGGSGNPTYIPNRNTTLHSSVTGAAQMCISENTSCTSWEAYAATKAFTISAGDGNRTLYVWYRDAAGNTIGSYNDTVILDTSGPVVSYFYIGSSSNPTYINTLTPSLAFSVTDASQMCVGTNATSCDGTWEAYATTSSKNIAAGEGLRTLYSWYRDVAGNTLGPVLDTVTLDTLVPSIASLTMTSNNALNNKQAKNGDTVSLNITFSEAITTLPTVLIGGRTVSTFTGSGASRVASYTIPAGEATLVQGNLSLSVSGYADAASNVGNSSTTVTSGGLVNYSRTIPACAYFYIGGESNPAYVTSTSTNLYSSCPTAQMCISTSSSSCNGTWETYSSTKAYTLSSGEGIKTLYAWYRDAAGNTSTMQTDSVYYDASTPTVTAAVISSNNALSSSQAKNGDTITLSITFSETITNTPTVTIEGRAASISGSGTTRTATYAIPGGEASLAEGSLSISISNYNRCIAGRTGSASSTITSGSVNYDRTAPTFTYFYIGGTGNPNSVTSLSPTAYFSVSGATQMCTGQSTGCSSWISYGSSASVSLAAGGYGTRTMYASFRDSAGNVTVDHSDSVKYLQSTHTTQYNSIASGYSYNGYNGWQVSTSTVIQGTPNSEIHDNYFGIMYFDLATIKSKFVDYSISQIVYTIYSGSTAGTTKASDLYVGGPCPTLGGTLPSSYTISGTPYKPTAIGTFVTSPDPAGSYDPAVWTITNSTWINNLMSANSDCVFMNKLNQTSPGYYWEGAGSKDSTPPRMVITWVPR